jgi:hypothetical protein
MVDKDEATSEGAMLEQLQAQLKPIFKDLSHEVPLLLFTAPGRNDPFSQATRFIIRAVSESRSGEEMESPLRPCPSSRP